LLRSKATGKVDPIEVPQQKNLDAFFEGVIGGSLADYQFDEKLRIGILVYGINGKSR
jgi:hypothetical protein